MSVSRSPFRAPRAAADQPADLTRALDELAEARRRADDIGRLVADGKCGASALHTAQWQVQQCLRRVDRIRPRNDHQGDAA